MSVAGFTPELFDVLGELVFLLDPRGRIVAANRAAAERLGTPQEKLTGLELRTLLISHADAPAAENALLGRQAETRLEFKRADKSILACHCSITPIGDPATAFLCLAREAAVRGAADDAMRVSEESAARMGDLAELAGGIAHEINTPLSAVLMAAGMIREGVEGNPTPEQRAIAIASLDTVESSTTSASRIIRNLLDFSRNAEDDVYEKVPVADLAESALGMFRNQFTRAGVTLDVKHQTPGLGVVGQRTALRQVLFELVRNALSALESLPEKKWIRIESRESGDFAQISVVDSGPGIPKDIRDRIFKPFFTTKGVGGGKGLGLSSAKGVVESHQGTLMVDPASTNTRFEIFLPRQRAETGSASTSRIQPNLTYWVGLDLPDQSFQLLRRRAADSRIKVVNEKTIAGVEAALQLARSHVGAFINLNGRSPAEIQDILARVEAAGISCLLSHKNPELVPAPARGRCLRLPFDAETLETQLTPYLASLVPARWDELFRFSAETAFRSLFPRSDGAWTATDTRGPFDQTVVCDAVTGHGIIRCSALVESSRLSNVSKTALLDFLGEFCNQTLGIMTFNLGEAGIPTKVGLPVAYEPAEFAALSGRYYFPTVRLRAPGSLIETELAMVRLAHPKAAGIPKLVFKLPAQDVEFF